MSNEAGTSTLAFDAVIFDLDGVVTQTAKQHAAAWKELFDSYLRMRADRAQEPFRPFDIKSDYLTYVDGKPRYEGVQSFLNSRMIRLPYGSSSDSPDQETVCGLGNKKDLLFERRIREQGVEVFETSIALIRALKAQGIKVAIVSSSKHCQEILHIAGIEGLFDARVDGVRSEQMGLRGKPDPDIFTKSAELLGVDRRRAIVVEDAIAGVEAGRNGGFGLVVGVDRANQREALKRHGADRVVSDLGEIAPRDLDAWFQVKMQGLPSALKQLREIQERLAGRRPAVFLDYDGTLTPIVERPELAVITGEMRETVRELASCCTTAVVSGRSVADVSRLVGIDELFYAGNHGFEIEGPQHTTIRQEKGREFLSAVEGLFRQIKDPIGAIRGAIVENKTYSLSVHYRQSPEDQVPRLEAIVDEALKGFPTLSKRHGKKVFEIRPRIDWDKGKAVLWLMDTLKLTGPDVVPFYLGDDVTDEDAFRALQGRGIGILVTDELKPSAACYSLKNPAEVKQFLKALIEIVQGRRV